MKEVLKNVVAKILFCLIVVGILAGGGYYIKYRIDEAKNNVITDETNIELSKVLEEKLQTTAELNTADYLCTYLQKFTDTKQFNGWDIPFTTKSFTVSYEGVVKAGIKDLTKAKVIEKDENTLVKLPKIEVTIFTIYKDTLQIYDEYDTIFNKINVSDVNNTQIKLEKEMVDRAIEYGLLDKAEENAKVILKALLIDSSMDKKYDIEFEFAK